MLTRSSPDSRSKRGDRGQPHTVRRERDVFDSRECLAASGPAGASSGRIGGLTARDAEAAESEWRELPDDLRDLLVREDVGLRQPRESLSRHAVDATEVAAVGDRDPEVLDAAPELVAKRLGRRRGGRRSRAGASLSVREAFGEAFGEAFAGAFTRHRRGRIDPLTRAIRVMLPLPDRHPPLDLLDHVLRRGQRGRAPLVGRGDRDADLADGEVADAMLGRRCDTSQTGGGFAEDACRAAPAAMPA